MVDESVARVFMSVPQTTSEMLAVRHTCFSSHREMHRESWPSRIVSHAWRIHNILLTGQASPIIFG